MPRSKSASAKTGDLSYDGKALSKRVRSILGAASRSSIRQEDRLLIYNDARGTTLSICGLEVTATCDWPAVVPRDADLDLHVDAFRFAETVGSLTGDLSLGVAPGDPKRLQLQIYSGLGRYRLGACSEKIEHALSPCTAHPPAKVAAGELLGALDRTAPHLTSDLMRPAMRGVLLEFDTGVMTATATDGYTLGTTSIAYRDVGGEAHGRTTILNPDMTKVLRTVLQAAGDTAEVDLVIGPKKVTVRCGEYVVTGLPINANFPKWREIVPQARESTVTVDRSLIEASLSRLSLYGPEPPKRHVRLAWAADGGLELSSNSVALERSAREVLHSAFLDGPRPSHVYVDPALLLRALKTMHGDAVWIGVRNASSPLTVESTQLPGGSYSQLALVMPVMVER